MRQNRPDALRRPAGGRFVLAVALLLIGCAHPLAAQQPARWTLDLELRIGREDVPEYALTSSRYLAVAEDGTMFLAQPRDPAIRVFDVNGKFVRSIGRRGQGPGEFTGLTAIGLRGDTLWASDRNRLHFFVRTGQHLQTNVIRYETGRPDFRLGAINAVLRDGTLATSPAYVPEPNVAWPSGLPLFKIRRGDGAVLDTIGLYDLGFFGFYRWNGISYFTYRPLHPYFLHASAPDGSAVVFVRQSAAERAQQSTFALTRVDHAGDTLLARQIPYQPIAVPQAIRDSVRANTGRSANGSLARDRIEAVLRDVPVPPFYPPVAAVTLATDGTTWLRLQGTLPADWLVVNAAGAVSARVRTQASLVILAVDGARVWGIERDELDVPTLVRYRINRNPAKP